jgi:uncharacterized protein
MEQNNPVKEAQMWAMFLHLSQLGNFLVPFSGVVAPIVIWQLNKDKMATIDEHGKVVVNWMISAFIYAIVCALLVLLLIGIPLLIVLAVLGVVFPIIGGIKANNGEVWKYPLSITFLK